VPEGTPVDIAEVYSAMGYSRDRKMFPFYFLISLGYLFVAPGHKIDFWNGGSGLNLAVSVAAKWV